MARPLRSLRSLCRLARREAFTERRLSCSVAFERERLAPSYPAPVRHLAPARPPHLGPLGRSLSTAGEGEAKEAKENIATVPNALSMARILATPVLGYCVLVEAHGAAAGLFLAAGLTDLLDGWIARRWPSQQSVFGSVLDPVADKLLVATTFGALTVTGALPLPLTALVVSRDVALIGVSFWLRWVSLPPPRNLGRFFDVSLPTYQAQPTNASKVNTALQLGLVAATLFAPICGYVGHPAMQASCWLVAGSTVVSALSYVFAKDTYRIIAENKASGKAT